MKNENDNEIKPTLEMSLCALLLESSRRYSALADAVFVFSVEQSYFANQISGQRMTLAKVVVQMQIDFVITIEGEALEIYQRTGEMGIMLEMWEDSLSLDAVIQEILVHNNANGWEPVILGIQDTGKKGEAFLKEITGGRGGGEAWQCINCGAIFTEKLSACCICKVASAWQKHNIT